MKVGLGTRHTSTKAWKAHAAVTLVLSLSGQALGAPEQGPRQVAARPAGTPAGPPPGPATDGIEVRSARPALEVQVDAPGTPIESPRPAQKPALLPGQKPTAPLAPATRVVYLPGAEPVLHGDVQRRRRIPWIATLCVSGATLVAGAVLGGLALDRARAFSLGVDAGAARDDLLGLRGAAHELAFTTDLLLGTAALMGVTTLVLRFGTAQNKAPEPIDLERAYQVPGEGRTP